MVRTAAGQMVPASRMTKVQGRKFLLVLSYFEGDQREAEELGALIADLERIRDRDTDVLIWGRFDSPTFSPTVVQKLEGKFGQVIVMKAKRNSTGHPYGANGMFYDLVSMLGQGPQWTSQYYAFLNLEADCVPMHPGWIGELQKAFRSAEASGKSCTGFIHNNPIPHMNGVAVWAIDIWKRVGTAKLSGGSPQVAYDIYHARNVLPHAEATPLIHFDYKRATISPDDLYRSYESGVEPALYHGVKDDSAREHVRTRHVQKNALARTTNTVFAYDGPSSNVDPIEHQAIIALWREGWRSRGWNPIILQERDAARHPQYAGLKEAVIKLPHTGDEEAHLNRFARWLALLSFSGGLMVDFEVLPSTLTPDALNPKETGILSLPEDNHISAAFFSREDLQKLMSASTAYDPRPEDQLDTYPHVSDFTVWTSLGQPMPKPLVANVGKGTAPLLRFPLEPGEKQSVTIKKFLKGS